MASFDELPADQQAVLQLVLRQGRTYDEIASLLKISPDAVRDRALTALDALGPADASGLEADREDEVGDYLLGQQSASERAATREHLEDSQPARVWARAVASELRHAGVAGDDALPEIPAEVAVPVAGDPADAFDAQDAPRPAPADRERSSRLGGVLLLIGVAIVIAAVILVATGTIGGGDGKGSTSAATPTTTSQTSTTTGATVERQINLMPPGGGRKPLGVANIVSQDGQRALAVVGQDLAPSGHYVLWLRNGSTVKFLGFFPAVTGKGTSKGRLQGLVAAPADLASYKEVLVSREPSSQPKQPTAIVLQGSIGG